jgi:hypothetical protein
MNYLAPLMDNVPKETQCSVPLIEMKVPRDVTFPVAQGLPACAADRP